MSSKMRLQLGELQLTSANRGLQLDLEACIEASSGERDTPAANDCDSSLARDLHPSISHDAWVCRGKGLRLIIELILRDGDPSTEDLAKLDKAIREAEAGIMGAVCLTPANLSYSSGASSAYVPAAPAQDAVAT